MTRNYLIAIITLGLVFSTNFLNAQRTEVSPKDTVKTAVGAKESEEKKKKKKPLFKKYEEVITEEAESTSGLFKTHRVEDKYYFEIPFDRLGKDMLLVSRIAKIPANLGGGYFNAGTKTNEQLVRWTRNRNNVHLKSVSYNSVADEELPINISVQNNNYAPLIMSFKIEAFNEDSTAMVISVNDLFLSDVPAISGLSSRIRTAYKVRSLDKKRSFIDREPSLCRWHNRFTYSRKSRCSPGCLTSG